MEGVWTISLFGSLRLSGSDISVTRFRTQKTAVLLARLAYPPLGPHRREELSDWLWPDALPADGRGSLRVALNSLRHHLEPPSVAAGAVLWADNFQVRLNPDAVTTDVGAWEAAWQSAARSRTPEERLVHLASAVSHYGGPLLPGFYDEWVLTERERLAQAHVAALLELAGASGAPAALEYALRAVAADPLREETHAQVIRLHLASGHPLEARRQFQECERLLMSELNSEPSQVLRSLLLPAPDAGRLPVSPRRQFAFRRSPLPETPSAITVPAAEPQTPPAAGRLPPSFAGFVGRREELDALTAALGDPQVRLLTLTGPGGVGKTRLALEAARRCVARGKQEVFFCALAEITDSRLLPTALRQTLGLPPDPDKAPETDGGASETGADWTRTCARLGQRPALLVLDNLEQVLAGGAALVDRLLNDVPTLTCLVTSRQRLGLEAECERPVLPLPVPPEKSETETEIEKREAPERVGGYDGVRLFVERAQAARPDFQVTPSNASAIAALVRGLEGIPLALELAAARARALTPRQMAAQLEQRFTFLVSRRRQGVERHSSLWAAVDWSYRLLPPDLRRFFRGLSVFRGGWTADAARSVCEEPQSLDFLEQLQECSLVESWEVAEEMRFRMLDTLREFGAEQLELGEAGGLGKRHAEWCLALAEGTAPAAPIPSSAPWLDQLAAEGDNLRAALEWSRQETEDRLRTEVGLRLAGALAPFWRKRDAVREGRRQVEEALRRADGAPPDTRAKLLLGAAQMAQFQNDLLPARRYLEESLRLWRDAGDRPRIAEVSLALGHLLSYQDGPRAAQAFFEESLHVHQSLGDAEAVAQTLMAMGHAALGQGNTDAARLLFEDALRLRRRQNFPLSVAYALIGLSAVLIQQGEYAQAQGRLEECLATMEAAAEPPGVAQCLGMLGQTALLRGDLASAETFYRQSLVFLEAEKQRIGITVTWEAFGVLAMMGGHYDDARTWFEKALTVWQELGNFCGIGRVLGGHLGGLALELKRYGEARRLREQSRELFRTSGNNWDIAVVAAGVAEVAAAQGDFALSRAMRRESRRTVPLEEPCTNLAALLNDHGRIALEEGQAAEAGALHRESLELYRQMALKPGIAESLCCLAAATFRAGDQEGAVRLFRDSLALWEEMGSIPGLCDALDGLAGCLAVQGQVPDAARLQREAELRRAAAGIVLSPRQQAARPKLLTPALPGG